ncbi:unnamed protein product [Prunus armeniaca]|uniref:Uncharacterized protein n=1 Tax=Prunus armeniaca TaxID=36596 RepID=A0A6J5XE34_PRUAR|nr:hypothetical protein GBA52_021730 [Prunus armeniaca]CAB4281804.1 unnamed protein product [Prunus armeniaca]CAB4312110.1 unnamed protein product [Prunus armeniaca]
MEVAHQDLGFCFGSARVSLTPILAPSSTRRLSSSFNETSRPVPARRKLAWVSLDGRLVNADEASSARAIKGGLNPEQAVAWELFSPIQRFLFVAVISVAAAESKKNRHITQLTKSVELRDQLLSSMQQKLDSLCEQMNNIKDHSATVDHSTLENAELQRNESFGSHKIKFVDCGCWLCDQHRDLQNGLGGNNVMKASNGDETLQYKMSLPIVQEQEERRMSDLSDLASSVTSAADIQLNTLAIEQDIYNLKKDCEEKDGTIQDLTTLLQSSANAGSRRIAELEDIIRRKNSTITRLKRDMVVLEQKVVHLTRLQRPSFSSSNSHDIQIPHMTDNLLYDMDSTTSPSSSDSDCSPVNRTKAPPSSKYPEVSQVHDSVSTSQKLVPEKASISMVKPTASRIKYQSLNPLKEITMNSRPVHSVSKKPQPMSPRPVHSVSKNSQPMSPKSQPASPKSQPMSPVKKSSTIHSSRPRQLSAGADSRKIIKRRSLPGRKDATPATPQKRWA